MKKIILSVSVILALLFSGCAPSETIPPLHPPPLLKAPLRTTRARPSGIQTTEVVIGVGETYDLLDGVTGSDDVDGDITGRIVIEKGGYDPDIAGKYTVTYNLTDSSRQYSRAEAKNNPCKGDKR